MNKSVKEIQKIIEEKIPEGLVTAQHNENGHFYLHNPTGLVLPSVTTKSSGILEAPHLKVWSARLAVEHIEANFDPNKPELSISKLKEGAIMVHRDQFEDAGGIGTLGHKVIENYLDDWILTAEKPKADITTYIKDNDARLFAIARSAQMFFNDFNFIPIASELFVASVKHKYAGTLDGLGLVMMPQKKCPYPHMAGESEHFWMQESTRNPYKVICRNCGLKAKYEFTLLDFKTSNQIDKPEYAMQVSAYWTALKEMTGLKPSTLLIIRLDKKQAKYEVMKVVDQYSAFNAFKHIAAVYDWLKSPAKRVVTVTPKEIISLI